jgi:hypothetical protein
MIYKILGKVNRLLGIKKNPREELLKKMPKNSVCAEIGVWKGGFSEQIFDVVQPSKLHLIDPWAFQPEFKERMFGGKVAKQQEDMDSIYEAVAHKFKDKNNVLLHRNFSDLAAEEFSDEYFDWIYIDGNHYYEFVLKDLELYYPKVKKGGFITGDDYDWRDEQQVLAVKKAVDEFCKKYSVKVISIMTSQFILRK